MTFASCCRPSDLGAPDSAAGFLSRSVHHSLTHSLTHSLSLNQDPGLQDPLSLSFTEDYQSQNFIPLHSRKTPASPDCKSETAGIHVVIKEEEEGWTVSDNNESFASGGEGESHTCRPPVQADGGESFILHGGQGNEPVYLEESDRSSWSRAEQRRRRRRRRRRRLADSDDGSLSPGIAAAHWRIRKAKASSRTRRPTCLQRPQVADGRRANRRTAGRPLNPPQSAGVQAGQWGAAGSPCGQTGFPNPGHPAALGSDASGGRSVCAGAEGPQKQQDDPTGGPINTYGEGVDRDAKDSPDQDSRRKPQCHFRTPIQGDSGPTLIVEAVEDHDNRPEEEESNRVVTVAAASSFDCGKRHRRKKVAETTVTLDETEPEHGSDRPVAAVLCGSVKRRSKRKLVEASSLLSERLPTGEQAPRRTRRKVKLSADAQSQEFTSTLLHSVPAKRPYRRRKGSKPPAEHSDEGTAVSAGKRRPGRKMLCAPLEIPPELLKKPREKIEYHCSVCGKEFPHAYKLERHELIHTGEKPYCCSVCGRGFNQKGNLKTHYKVHAGGKDVADLDDLNPIQSEFCEYLKSLPGESKIRSSLHCLECGKKCESQSALQAHHITTHAEPDPDPDPEPEPDQCGSAQLLSCRRCHVQFGSRAALQQHLASHTKEKRYPCPDCGKRFINESYVQVHRRIHTGERPFLCAQCGRAFHTASSLRLHEMQHSGERPFACALCGKAFRINSYLTAHYQTHVRHRPFVCAVCGKGYSRAEELKVHQRLHTGERPYACAQCGKSFIYRQGLRQHQRTHQGRRIGPTRQLGRPKQEARAAQEVQEVQEAREVRPDV